MQDSLTALPDTLSGEKKEMVEFKLFYTLANLPSPLELINSASIQLHEAARTLRAYRDALDLDPERVARAKQLGMDAGESDPEKFKALVRDLTNGFGADKTLMTAATR